MASNKSSAALPQQVWRIAEWRQAARISRSLHDKLPPEQRPKIAIVGKRPRVIESPLDWLLRINKHPGQRRGR